MKKVRRHYSISNNFSSNDHSILKTCQVSRTIQYQGSHNVTTLTIVLYYNKIRSLYPRAQTSPPFIAKDQMFILANGFLRREKSIRNIDIFQIGGREGGGVGVKLTSGMKLENKIGYKTILFIKLVLEIWKTIINFRNICGTSINSNIFENLPPNRQIMKISKISISTKVMHLNDNGLC